MRQHLSQDTRGAGDTSAHRLIRSLSLSLSLSLSRMLAYAGPSPHLAGLWWPGLSSRMTLALALYRHTRTEASKGR